MKKKDQKSSSITKVLDVWNEKNNVDSPSSAINKVKFINQVANSFTPGDFYYYIFNFETLTMEYVHPTVKDILGVEPQTFTLDNIFAALHPDDIDKMHEKENAIIDFLFNQIDPDDLTRYKAVYIMRLKHSDGTYKKILHQSRTINVSKDGKIQQVLGIHSDITYLNNPIDHKVSFIGIDRPSFHSLDPKTMQFDSLDPKHNFTNREVEIIALMANGKSAEEIAEELFLSLHTVKTHKKNILNKSEASNTMQLVAKCIREGII